MYILFVLLALFTLTAVLTGLLYQHTSLGLSICLAVGFIGAMVTIRFSQGLMLLIEPTKTEPPDDDWGAAG